MTDKPRLPLWAENTVKRAMEEADRQSKDPFSVPPPLAKWVATMIASALHESEDQVTSTHEQSIMDKLRVALSVGFSRGRVFYEKRWQRLERPFQRYQAELSEPIFEKGSDKVVGWTEVPFEEAWNRLVLPALLGAFRAMPMDLKEGRYRFLRREVRRGVEQYLMDGLTTDSKREASLELLAELHLDDEPDTDNSLGEFEVDMELVAELSGLLGEFENEFTPEVLELSQAQYGEAAALAEKYSISIEAMRKRIQRARHGVNAWRAKHALGSSSLV